MGSGDVFDEIFNRYGGKLFGFAFKYLKLKEETKGLDQNAFLKVWENRKKLKRNLHLKPIFLRLHIIICVRYSEEDKSI